MLELGDTRRYRPGQVLLTLSASPRPARAALIVSGLVKVTAFSAGDSQAKTGILLSVRGPGDLVGEETAILGEAALNRAYGDGRITKVITLSEVSASVFAARMLRGLLQDHPGS